jgi:hypothetical protein
MRKEIQHRITTLLCALIILEAILPTSAQAANLTTDDAEILQEVRLLIPISIQMIDSAVTILDRGWSGMTPTEREQFIPILDPGKTGQMDDQYVETLRNNYLKIRQRLGGDLVIEYSENSDMCIGQRLYYTDFLKIYVCPYFMQEDRAERKVRTLIHETAHMALLVVDRPYYDPKSYSSRYNALTPRGSRLTQIPVIGHLIREINHSDTLYHPDAYAWLATEISELQ